MCALSLHAMCTTCVRCLVVSSCSNYIFTHVIKLSYKKKKISLSLLSFLRLISLLTSIAFCSRWVPLSSSMSHHDPLWSETQSRTIQTSRGLCQHRAVTGTTPWRPLTRSCLWTIASTLSSLYTMSASLVSMSPKFATSTIPLKDGHIFHLIAPRAGYHIME